MEKRLGLWIPLEVMNLNNLDWENKILLTKILSLHKAKNGCIASNQYFGRFLGITSGAASKRISKLVNTGYIKTENVIKNGSCIGRVITPEGSLRDAKPSENDVTPQASFQNLSIQVVPTEPRVATLDKNAAINQAESTSPSTISVLPDQPGGSSLTTTKVLPNQPEGSSPGNTINTSIITDKEKEKQQELLKQAPKQYTGPDSEITKSSSLEEKGISPIKKMREAMAEWFDDYPNWEPDLYNLGLNNFIEKTARKYKTDSQESREIIKYFLSL